MSKKKSVLKHQEAVDAMLAMFHEPWMTEVEKKEVVEMALEQVGATKESLDADIEAGVKNGFPADFQIQLFKETLAAVFKRLNHEIISTLTAKGLPK